MTPAPASNLIDGRAIAEQLHAETAQRVAALQARGVTPGLVFVRVGEDPASQVYVGMKERVSARLGIASTTHVLPEATTEAELLALLNRLAVDGRDGHRDAADFLNSVEEFDEAVYVFDETD